MSRVLPHPLLSLALPFPFPLFGVTLQLRQLL